MLHDLPRLRPGETAARCEGDFRVIPAGETYTVMDVQGAGVIRHLWFTVPVKTFEEGEVPPPALTYKHLILRIWWDGEEHPSVEVPLGDFFCQAFGLKYPLSSAAIAIGGESTGLNMYFPMPFASSARIEVTNETGKEVKGFYHYVDYVALDDPSAVAGMGRFHAFYRQETPVGEPNYCFLETRGEGTFIGLNIQTHAQADGWWGEGGDLFRIDKEDGWSLIGTGSEDYFCNGWGFEENQSHPYFGSPLFTLRNGRSLLYRWHIPDPIPFREFLRGEIRHHGHIWESRAAQLAGEPMKNACTERLGDNYYSVAYWYQTEPHPPFAPLPDREARMPYPLIGPKSDEVFLHEDLRCVLLREQGDDGGEVAAIWGLYGEAAALNVALDNADVQSTDALGREKPFSVDNGRCRFPVDPRVTYIRPRAMARDALRDALKQAEVEEQ